MPSPKNYPRAKVPLTGDEMFTISQHDPIKNAHVAVMVSLNDILGPLSPFIKKVTEDTETKITMTADQVRSETSTQMIGVSTMIAGMSQSTTGSMEAVVTTLDTVKRDLEANTAALKLAITKAVANVVTKDVAAPSAVYRYSANLNFGGLLTIGKQTRTFTVPGVKVGDAVLLTPRNALPSTFMLGEATCLANDTLQVTMFSSTALTLGSNTSTFDVVCFR